MSAHGLHDNPGLVLFAVLAQLLSAAAVILAVAAALLAYENGDVMPNSARPAPADSVMSSDRRADQAVGKIGRGADQKQR